MPANKTTQKAHISCLGFVDSLGGLITFPFSSIGVSLILTSLKPHLTLQVCYLISITSAKKVSEIQALVIKEPYLIFYPDRVILRPSDHFIPKVATLIYFN